MTLDERRQQASQLVGNLTSAEHQALASMVGGDSLIRIAAELELSLEETALLKASLMKKLEASASADLIRIAIYARVGEDR